MRPLVLALLLTLAASPALAAEAPPPGLPPCPTDQDAPDPVLLVKRAEQTLEGSSSVGTMTMTIKTAAWSRKLKMKVWARGQDYALVRILEGGPRETGMMTLKREKQLWNYLPQAGRVMKLPSGMLGDSWMGSDFTNDDLVNGSSLVDDFEVKLAGALQHEGRAAWRLELVPRESAKVVWGKLDLVLDRATCAPLLERFFDEDGKLARSMVFGEPRAVGWRQFPSRVSVKPQDEKRETTITYEEIEFDVKVPDDVFSLHRLQQGR